MGFNINFDSFEEEWNLLFYVDWMAREKLAYTLLNNVDRLQKAEANDFRFHIPLLTKWLKSWDIN